MDQRKLPKEKKKEKLMKKKAKMRPKIHACHRKRVPRTPRALPVPSRVCHKNCCQTKSRQRPVKRHQAGPPVPQLLRQKVRRQRENVLHLPDFLVLVMQNQVEARRRMKCLPKTLIEAHVPDCPSDEDVEETRKQRARLDQLLRGGIM